MIKKNLTNGRKRRSELPTATEVDMTLKNNIFT